MHTERLGARRLGCLACGQAVRRVRRQDGDRGGAEAAALRRYACRSAGCGWQGLLPRESARQRASRHVHGWTAALRALPDWGLAALLAGSALSIAAIVALGGVHPRRDPGRNAPALAAGEHGEGVAVAAAHPMAHADPRAAAFRPDVERLRLRQHCAWGLPGRNPYQGTVEQALLTARLPPEVVERIAGKVQRRHIDDRLEIATAGIRADRDRREFEPTNVALTYGRTLCVNARVNFPAGHVERASLYEAADRSGRLYSVMVPDVCGNVSVLGVRRERRRPAPAPDIEDGVPPVLVLIADPGEGARRDPSDPGVHTVPEPPGWAAVAAAFAGWGVAALLRRRRWRRDGA